MTGQKLCVCVLSKQDGVLIIHRHLMHISFNIITNSLLYVSNSFVVESRATNDAVAESSERYHTSLFLLLHPQRIQSNELARHFVSVILSFCFVFIKIFGMINMINICTG